MGLFPAQAAVVNDRIGRIEIGLGQLEYLEDKPGQLSLTEALNSSTWQASTHTIANFGYSSSVYWFKFTVRNEATTDFHSITEVQYPIIDRIDFFVMQGNTLLKQSTSGDMLNFDVREVQHRHHLLPLVLDPGKSYSIILRVETESSVQVPIILWEERVFWTENQLPFAIQFGYFGVMAGLLVYNLFIFFSHKAKSYIHYVFFVLFYAVFQISLQGFGSQFLWPNSPDFNRLSLPLSIALALHFACLFTISFLSLRSYCRSLYRLAVAGAWFTALMAVAAFFVPTSKTVPLGVASSIPISILCIFAGAKGWRAGNPLGLYFSIAWIIFILGTIMAALNKFGAIERNMVTEFSQQIGSCLEVTLLSFALAYKMNLTSKEKFQAQKEATEAQEALNKIQNEANEQLERKVEERTEQLHQKTMNLNMMLQHLQQGVLMVIDGGIVHPEYSAFLVPILERENLAGALVIDLLFSGSELSTDQIQGLNSALDFSIGSNICSFEANSELLIREYRKEFPDGRVKILELDWNPITGENDDTVERIMVTVRDVTEFRAIKQNVELQKRELDTLGRILEAKPQRFERFLENSETLFNQCMSELQSDAGSLDLSMRNLHTIKGNSRVYGFDRLASLVHEAEELLLQLRKGDEPVSAREALLHGINLARAELESYRTLYNSKLKDLAQNDGVLVESLRAQCHALENRYQDRDEIPLAEVRTLIHLMERTPLADVLNDIILKLPELAMHLGKPTPEVVFHGGELRIDNGYIPMLQNIFVHLFRNALDHGIESPDLRSKSGKNARGRIDLTMERWEDEIQILLRDDGRGLNLQKLKLKSGILEPGDTAIDRLAIARAIFLPGVSTAESLTEISGRGVGLDAVRDLLQKQACDIDIRLLQSENLEACPFEFIIRLPKPASLVMAIPPSPMTRVSKIV